MTPQEIISDKEITRVHGHANFGDMSPREVVNDGVRKYAVGFTGGHTQLCILLEHCLIRKPNPGKYSADLTKKGKRYARSIWKTHFALAIGQWNARAETDRLIAEAVAAERERCAKIVQDYLPRWCVQKLVDDLIKSIRGQP